MQDANVKNFDVKFICSSFDLAQTIRSDNIIHSKVKRNFCNGYDDYPFVFNI